MAGYGVELSCSGEEAVQRLTQVLAGQGFRVARGFDLRSAMAAHPEDCPCPYHGTVAPGGPGAGCTCNYTVLLVYGRDAAGGATLPSQRIVIHSHHDQTWLTLLPDWEGRDEPGPADGPGSDDPLATAQASRLTLELAAAVSEISA